MEYPDMEALPIQKHHQIIRHRYVANLRRVRRDAGVEV